MNTEVWLFFSSKDFFLLTPVMRIQFLSDVKRELDKLSDFLQRHLGGGSGSRTFTITKEEKRTDRQASRGAGELSTAYVSTLRSTIEQLLQVRSVGLFFTFPPCKFCFHRQERLYNDFSSDLSHMGTLSADTDAARSGSMFSPHRGVDSPDSADMVKYFYQKPNFLIRNKMGEAKKFIKNCFKKSKKFPKKIFQKIFQKNFLKIFKKFSKTFQKFFSSLFFFSSFSNLLYFETVCFFQVQFRGQVMSRLFESTSRENIARDELLSQADK